MRLIAHNLLICNVSQCQQNSFPLSIEVQKAIYKETEFNFNNIKKLVKKLDWDALHKTVSGMGEKDFPMNPVQSLEDELFLRRLHRIILDTHIMEGKLKCPNCKKEYTIRDGIPNMILKEN